MNDEKITCKTVPGIGENLFWKVTVRDQTNDLSATSSYSVPKIHSITPSTASADGSDVKDFFAFLNVSNSGLADPLSNIVVQMDPACELTLNTCGPYEIPIEPRGTRATRTEGNFDILAFRIPMLMTEGRQ